MDDAIEVQSDGAEPGFYTATLSAEPGLSVLFAGEQVSAIGHEIK